MLSRRILRIKAFKSCYSIAENPSISLKEAESALEKSCESTRDLYLFLLALAAPLTREASSRIEAARSKFNPTEEEKNPNMKFVGNGIAPLLEDDPDFSKIISKKHLSWDQYDVFLRNLYNSLRETQFYKEYMAKPERSIADDAKLFSDIYANLLEDNADLASILEDLSIWWTDDLAYALTWCCKAMEHLGKGLRWSLPPLYMSELPGNESLSSDHAFVVGIVRKACLNMEKYVSMISEITPKWDSGRICTTDLALIVAGLAESESCPSMPTKVIINEYVEISKYYSTPESRSFVNGILDKLINKR